MRNIKFDESTVLREFARIAQEQGLVKVASDEMTKEAANPLYDEAVRLNELSAKLMEKYKGDHLRAKKELDQHIAQSVAALSRRFPKNPNEIAAFKTQVSKLLAPQYAGEAETMVAQLPPSRNSVEGDEVVTAAKEGKEYDVTGETGEDLVNQAHPGGGTKTELTHSKTKENLVETIVEQQKADLEVVKKMPKGTYASMVNLYTKLAKMGHKDKLDGLKEIIRAVATPEDVLSHVLVVLADDLDKLGYKKQANQVDELLKKS